MIDLSFLTEEEQETILAVLKRDAELKKAEEQRVQALQRKVSDRSQLRYLTGEWFYETKQLRHQDRIHGSDIIMASMRHTHKPLTILELSQILPEKSSFVSSENKEVFVPPVLCGLLQEPHLQLSNERYQNQNPYETPQDTSTPVLQSPSKQRKNPFNSELRDSHLLDGAVDQTQKPNEEPLPSSDSSISYASNLREGPNNLVAQNASVSMPMPKNRAVSTSSQDCFVEVDGPGCNQTNSAAPRGILKHLSTSSSTDSLFSHLDLQSPVSLDSPTEHWTDRKQVRFSTMVSHSGDEWQDGKELGEHSLLDIDSTASSAMEDNRLNNRDFENAGRRTSGTHKLLLSQSRVDSQEGELSCRNETDFREQEAGQHQVLSDVSEHCHSELLSPEVSSLVSAEQESGKPVHLETETEEDRDSQATATDGPTRHNTHQQNLPENSTDISIEATSDSKPSASGSSKSSSNAVLPQPRQKMHGIFRREKEKSAELQSQQKEPGYDDCSSPVMSALKRLSSRSISSSKSVENLTSQTREERTENNSREQMNLSVDDVSSLPPSASSLSKSKQVKSSVSVPVIQQDETDSDSTFETNLGWRRNTGSSTSNISLSSGMASMLSVGSGSISSLHPAEFGDIEVQGNIQFAVNYIQKLREFHIFVVHCRELAVADAKKNRSDPYVKCYLLPDKTKLGKRKTAVKKKTLNPTYNEILRFKVVMEVLKTQNLNISVWHNDTFGRNIFLGEVDLDLSEWDFSNTQINEYTLKARVSAQTSALYSSHLMDGRGLMRLALRFLPQTSHSKTASRMETGEVQIWVKDCKNLPSVRGVIIDPFVKCTVLPDTSRKSRQKTRVVKRTANPMFNHTMVYDGFRTEDLREACVEITVWDHDRLSSHYIGGLRLGLGTGKSYGMDVVWMDSTTDEANLWQQMLESVGEWVEDVLPLRMLMMAKSMSK
ncbi:synaptotagmin-like protein 2 isoform X5 [Trachinotus anak]|uniref:synaptotagmin-like protein 2 isoform X5 n=1 Tax=Trachinotus anak TaxID=443729 RepID=UPI0039F20AE6